MLFNQALSARDLIDELYRTNEIYSAFTGRGGSALEANTIRETGMKAQFLEAWDQVDRNDPHIMFVFGANHMMRGHSRTHVSSLGNFLAEWGYANDLSFFNVAIDCVGGEMREVRSGQVMPCQAYFDLSGTALQGVADNGPVVVDLKSIRPWLIRSGDEHAQLRDLALAFDALILLPDVKPATLISAQ